MPIVFDFIGKVALITGSSTGIGAATAISFAKAGANVVITGRNSEKLAVVAEKCQQISSNKLKPIQVLGDVTKEEDLKRLVDTTIKEFGKIDILVNNAGYGDNRSIIDSDYMKVYKSIMNTNLNSVVYLTHLCAQHLAKTKGNIINVSSVAGFVTGPKNSPYCMAKSAMDMFTKCMAAELGPKGIRVNSINPGAVKTDIITRTGLDKNTSDAIFKLYEDMYPIRRVGEPEDIANGILYLASNEASYMTGTLMLVDGGHIAANVSVDFKLD